MSHTDTRPVTGTRPASDTDTSTPSAYRRVLIPIQDAAQAEHAMELARRAGASEALVLHLNLRESYGGRRFALETDSEASRVVEATVLELRMAGIAATGQVRPALVDRAAGEIIAEATDWGADLIVLGFPRRFIGDPVDFGGGGETCRPWPARPRAAAPRPEGRPPAVTRVSRRPAGGGRRGGPGSGSPRCAARSGRSPVSPPGTCPPGQCS